MKPIWTYVILAWLSANLGHVSSLCAKEIQLLWTEKRIDDGVILQFANFNEDEMIKHFRSHYPDLKVLILDIARDDLELNLNLTIGNLAEDKEAVKFYTHQIEYATSPHTGRLVTGAFLYPFFHMDDAAPDRPDLDKTILLFSKNSTRSSLIHEFVHFHLYGQVPHEFYTEKDSQGKEVKHSEVCRFSKDMVNLAEQITAKQSEVLERQKKAKTDADRIAIASEYYDLLLDFYIKHIYHSLDTDGEEIDVHRLMVDYRKELGFTEFEWLDLSLINSERFLVYLYEDVKPALEDPNIKLLFRDLEAYPTQIQAKAQALHALLTQIQDKAHVTAQWYEEELIKLDKK